MNFKRYPERTLRHVILAPFIYTMFVPFVVLDVCVEIYHHVCFPLYGLTYVNRSQYIRIDRQKLSYLNLIEKFNCMYCGYANGLLAYVSKIASETEKYWCGIKHDTTVGGFIAPEHHDDFIDYGDEENFKELTPKK